MEPELYSGGESDNIGPTVARSGECRRESKHKVLTKL